MAARGYTVPVKQLKIYYNPIGVAVQIKGI